MNKKDSPYKPPKWADKLLERICSPELLEEVLGDLHERFYRRVEKSGLKKANKIYVREVMAYLRPSFLKTPTNENVLIMDIFKNYLKIAFRNIARNTTSSSINISGLSVGLTASLFIALFIFQEFSYDKNHKNAERTYRVETQKIRSGDTEKYAGAPLGVASVLRTNFPGVETVTSMVYRHGQLIYIPYTANNFSENMVFADHHLFSVLDYQWISGNPELALTEPNTVLLTEETARKFFNLSPNIDVSRAVGQIVNLNNQRDLKVVGIIQNPPKTTSFPFNIIVSFSTLESINPDLNFENWEGWSDNNQTYVVLKKGVEAKQVEQQFPGIIEKYYGEGKSGERGHVLVPLEDIHFSYNYGGRENNKSSLYSLGLIGMFLLLIATINFVNLATAQATERAKEVGIRKALGSSRIQLIFQFMSEAIVVTLISFLLALSLLLILIPYVSEFMGTPLDISMLFVSRYIAFMLAVFVTISFLSGLYPAWIIARFDPVRAFNKKISTKQGGGFTLRQVMVTLQFVVCQILLIGTVVISRQMHFFNNADLGFDSEAIVVVDLPGQSDEQLETFRGELLQNSQITEVSFSNNSASSESNYMGVLTFRTDSGEVEIRSQFKYVDANFLGTYEINLIAGNTLQKEDKNKHVLINEVLVKRMGLSHMEQAIGQPIGEYIVKGVVENFHVNSLHQAIDPTVLVVAPQHYYQAGIKLHTDRRGKANQQAAIAKIQDVWEDIFPKQVFSYKFLDESLAKTYEKEDKMMRIINLFAGIAIFISCLGLYGLVSFVIVQRTKEMGIRKVLGAGSQQIIYLFTKDFVMLISIAFIIAAPIGYYFMQQWLADFVYKITISWWMFAVVILVGFILAGITVSFQSIKIAFSNPIDSLRNE